MMFRNACGAEGDNGRRYRKVAVLHYIVCMMMLVGIVVYGSIFVVSHDGMRYEDKYVMF